LETVTEEGTARLALLSEMETEVLLVAAEERVTVQAAALLEERVDGEQLRDVSVGITTGALRVMEAVREVPLRVAVMVAKPVTAKIPAVAGKVAEA
jgi:hypothetical protein